MPPVPNTAERTARRATHGLSLIELLIFISVVSVALVALLRVFVQATQSSADPLLQRQALAIAESLLEEVQLMPFSFCDSDDANVETAADTTGCVAGADANGPDGGETRTATPPFDHVNDYHGLAMTGIVDLTNTAVAGLGGYTASVAVAAATLGTIDVASGDALRITVTVDGPGGTRITLDGYRSRHAPNASL